jgi:hypothetical protein
MRSRRAAILSLLECILTLLAEFRAGTLPGARIVPD